MQMTHYKLYNLYAGKKIRLRYTNCSTNLTIRAYARIQVQINKRRRFVPGIHFSTDGIVLKFQL